MGNLEKLVVAGAVSLVMVLLTVLLFNGLAPNGDSEVRDTEEFWGPTSTDWPEADAPTLVIPDPEPVEPTPIPAPVVAVVEPEPAPTATEASMEEPAESAPEEVVYAVPLAEAGIRPYIVQSGDTLERIAKREFSSAAMAEEIRKVNEGRNWDLMRPGETIFLPLESSQPPQTATVESDPGARYHTVADGDSLWRISKQYYGTGAHYDRILKANSRDLPSPDDLKPGMRLRIP